MRTIPRILFLSLLFFNCTIDAEIEDPTTNVEGVIEETFENETSNSTNTFTPCENGKAGIFPCQGYDLLSRVTLSEFNSSSANDNWGWTDPETGIEYVLNGLNDGTGFVSIEDPENPVYLGKLPTETQSSLWRDIKVYNNHAFIVSEAQGHGLQIFDLTKLRGVTDPQIFSSDKTLTNFGRAHNIAINQESGFAYVLGSELYNGGPVFIDISDPKNATVVGGFEVASYTHDAQIVNYQGPDENFQGRELFFGSNSDGGANNQIVIVDVTDKENPEWIQSIAYENGGYTHQGYLSEDHRYFFLGDELDEINFGSPTSTRIFDLTDLSAPRLHFNYFAGVNAIDHNGYVRENLFFLASYTAGLRVLDISGIDEKQIEEIGFFDTFPTTNKASFNGAWNVYPYFESGVIAINDIESGLFIVKATQN
jgi:choice-of-anchor B domain-containing protein